MLLAALSAVLVAACTAAPTRTVTGGHVPTGATRVAGGCGATQLYKGASPAWTASAGPPTSLVQGLARAGEATAFIFGYPLRAGHPENPDNKILWVVRQPRNGAELVLSGHPLDRAAPTVEVHEPADSSPGEIYPSIVDVPSPGCWQFTLRWGPHRDIIELPYHP